MVLRDIDSQAPDSFTEPSNPSDADPYASTSSSLPHGERFDASNMASPVPVLGPLMGFSARGLRFKADMTLSFAEKKLGRVLTPEEAQALATHIYKLEASKSWYAALGAGAGAYRWYATRATYQYPFYKPRLESIDVNKFGPIKGPAANLARQTWRFGLYALVAGQMGTIIGQLIAQPIAAYETSVDPKLEEFAKDIKAASAQDERSNTERAHVIEERRKDFDARRRQEGTGGMTPPYAARGGEAKSQPQPPPAPDDDMSPTAGAEPWDSQTSSWGAFTADEQPEQQPQQPQQPRPPRAPRQPYQAPRPPPPAPFDDDTSPTSGLFASETTSTAQPPTRAESSWDRLRRGASTAPNAPQSRTQQPRPSSGSGSGDSFRDEQDREREGAQREFDERLERERRGGDFNEREGRW